jgi:hypothetical protein
MKSKLPDFPTYDQTKAWVLQPPTPLFVVAKRLNSIRGVRVRENDLCMIIHSRFRKLPMIRALLKKHGYKCHRPMPRVASRFRKNPLDTKFWLRIFYFSERRINIRSDSNDARGLRR